MAWPKIAYINTCNRAFLYFHPLQSLDSETDLSSMYFLCRDETNSPCYVSRKTISQMILNPKNPTPQHSTLKMRPKDLSVPTKPAHIPNYDDMYPVSTEGKSGVKWCLEYLHTIPRNLTHLIDPTPLLDFSVPTIRLCLDTVYLCMGTFTDAFQVVEVPIFECMVIIQIYKAIESKQRGPFNIVAFDPITCPSWVPYLNNVLLKTRIVTWNVRGIARGSFLENFRVMHEIFNPSVVVLLETRHLDENVTDVVNRLPWRFLVRTYLINSCSGGTSILYKEELIKVVGNPLVSSCAILDVVLQGRKSNPSKMVSFACKNVKGESSK